ncbi:MAG: UDP-3-O-(3-hydroxymyristoyl)glucosamine N-acyltransferase [Alphaproteobacteria bacterium]|jgi:UDP-3-O-[3-hydroxymyristoyl] glucosamine N-acyltransferase|nr:UDP-3-O-(3-hydroxymyristoyl)glucosamine N-acyltransferase [Alphaproteobacteria bacterium]MDP6563865.1 UDP-3-O-(3-hydroxymyristoyl)glucosamine N-acyltransferase [Alphaproteobacteria bacterium]MDP6814245.1 UDP-3-O-(3-hydroxymyristoyl)glucosamine N-acyltransferase [Alphaproteobacteria bacterium]
MADSRFFHRQGPFTLAELAGRGGAELADGVAGDREIEDVAPLETATAAELSFLDNKAYIDAFAASAAGAAVIAPHHADRAPADMALLLSEQPYRCFALIAQAFYPRPRPLPGISAAACVDGEATLGADCQVEAGAVIAAGAEIGDRCRIGANATIAEGVRLGEDGIVHANVSLGHCLIGDRVTLHPGVRIGQDGFGFAIDPGGHVKVPQVGRVLIGDDCDIGANTTIDRGSMRDTVIGAGCWIDNLVQIGHNVELGRGCVLAAMTGISGSTKVGDFVAIGGQVGMAGHLNVGDGAQIAAQSGIMADVPPGATVCGSPAVPIKQFFRQVATLSRLSQRRTEGND